MKIRLRYLIITGIALCHGITPAHAQSAGNQLNTAPCSAIAPPPGGGSTTSPLNLNQTVHLVYQEATLDGDILKLTGNVVIHDDQACLAADTITYNKATGEAVAEGHVAFDVPAEATHIEGSRATFNYRQSTGEFDEIHGVSGIRTQANGRNQPMSENPLVFSGSRLFRLGERHYRLEHGQVTACVMSSPKWLFSAGNAEIELGDEARLYHTTFYLLQIPVFYFPYVAHSIETEGRHSGFLLPVVNRSSSKGLVLGDSFYWAAARNLNVTVGSQYYSSRGWADLLDIAGLPSRTSQFHLQLDGVFDRGVPGLDGAQIRQGGQEVHASGEQDGADGVRTVLDGDYVSSYDYRLEFQNSFAAAINSEAISNAFSEKQGGGLDAIVDAHRYQNFLGTTPTASLSLATLPSLEGDGYALPLPLGSYFSFDADAGLLDRAQPGFQTGALTRLDFNPLVTVPWATELGEFTLDLGVRGTLYSEQQALVASHFSAATQQLLRQGLWRRAGIGDLQWRPPALERVYDTPGGWLGDRVEHVIEPELAANWVGGVGQQADEIIRFDDRDILSDTRELDYGITNRLLSANGEAGSARELASWTVEQKYFFDPTFGGALIPGARNVFLATELLSPFDFEALPRRFSPFSSTVRVSPFKRFDGDWRVDVDARSGLSASAFTANIHLSDNVFFSGSHYLLREPPGIAPANAISKFNQLRLSAGYGEFDKPGLGVAAAAAYDLQSGLLQYTTMQTTYNWDCAGFSIEYRRFSLASVRRENQFGFSLTLSDVGTFGNLKRTSRLF